MATNSCFRFRPSTCLARTHRNNRVHRLPLAEIFPEFLRRADEICRPAVCECQSRRDSRSTGEGDQFSVGSEQQRIDGELTRLEIEDSELRQCWTEEWDTLGSALLSPAEMKEWMQLRQLILDRVEQCRDKRERSPRVAGTVFDGCC